MIWHIIDDHIVNATYMYVDKDDMTAYLTRQAGRSYFRNSVSSLSAIVECRVIGNNTN